MTPWTLAPCLEQLRAQVNTAAPLRSKAADGTIGDAAHAATISDHNPDLAGVVRALDITHDPAHGMDAHALADAIVASRDPRIKYVISRGRMARSYPKPGIPTWSWAPYTGPDPHTGHAHVSVVDDHRADSVAPWRITKSPAQPPKEWTDMATKQEIQQAVEDGVKAALADPAVKVSIAKFVVSGFAWGPEGHQRVLAGHLSDLAAKIDALGAPK